MYTAVLALIAFLSSIHCADVPTPTAGGASKGTFSLEENSVPSIAENNVSEMCSDTSHPSVSGEASPASWDGNLWEDVNLDDVLDGLDLDLDLCEEINVEGIDVNPGVDLDLDVNLDIDPEQFVYLSGVNDEEELDESKLLFVVVVSQNYKTKY